MKKISFVIPCYRSHDTIGHVVTEIDGKMEKMKTFRFGVAWSMFGYQTVRVPVDMTEEEAMLQFRAADPVRFKAYFQKLDHMRSSVISLIR